MSDLVILSATRTPLGGFQGAFAATPTARLGAAAIKSAVTQSGVAAADITDVLMGCVLPAGQGMAPARQAALYAGLNPSVRTATVNKVCGSGLQTLMQGAHALRAGLGEFVVAGGMENMSLAPYLAPKARAGLRLGHAQLTDSIIHDGLWDPYNDIHMGNCAEQCAAKYKFSRAEQDAYAIESFKRATAAQQAGLFAAEITPIETSGARGETTLVEHDEGPTKVRYDKIPTLKPVFHKDGTVTAANASSLNDGAAALVIARAADAQARGLKPLARIVAFGAHAHEPLWFTTAPVQATQNALKAADWSVTDVDLWEVNEAFAVVPLAFMRKLGVPPDRVNVRGGAIALGHPLGCSGARIVVTLLAALRERGRKRGVATICIGGGEGLAVGVELM